MKGFESDMEGADTRPERGWAFPGLCVVLGIYFLADYFYAGGVHRAVFGLGFLMLVPSLFLHPVPMRTPMAALFTQPRRPTNWDWVAIAGTFVLIAGIVLRWTVARG